jgi:hypothetical protein
MEDFNKRGMWGKVITTHNTREEEVLAEFDERFVTALSTEYKTRIREWIKYTLHQELQKARSEMLHKLHLCAIGKYEGDALENVKAQLEEYQAEL